MIEKRWMKILLAAFTLWPIIYIFLFVFVVFMAVALDLGRTPGGSLLLLAGFAVHILTIFSIFVLLAIYMIDVFKNDRVVQDKKALWAVALFFGGLIAMPVYWYWYIWSSDETVVPLPESNRPELTEQPATEQFSGKKAPKAYQWIDED